MFRVWFFCIILNFTKYSFDKSAAFYLTFFYCTYLSLKNLPNLVKTENINYLFPIKFSVYSTYSNIDIVPIVPVSTPISTFNPKTAEVGIIKKNLALELNSL